MASIRKEIVINVRPDQAWDTLRDWAALHRRLAPSFAVDTRLDGRDRIVTFFNGAVVREVLVDLDDPARRLAWTIVDGPYTHHNASAQVFISGDDATRFVWVADLLPDETAKHTSEMMQQGLNAAKRALESGA